MTAREEFLAALQALGPGRLDGADLAGEWGARELIAHLGYWAGHAVETIHAVEDGRAGEFGSGRPSVDEVNETVARVARQTDLEVVRKREAGSFEALVERLRRMDPSLLSTRLAQYDLSLEEALREDGPDHYREHADAFRRSMSGEGD